MMQSPLQPKLTRKMAYRPIQARAYRANNIAPPLYKLPAYAGVSLRMAYEHTWQSRPMGPIKAQPLIDTMTQQ